MTEEINLILDMTKENMDSSMTHLDKELRSIRAGKANPSMLETVKVDYYGTATPLSQVANVNTPDGRTLSIQPWEKSILEEIEKAIINSNLGLNPQNNGEMIIISVPPLTEERRKDLSKKAKAETETARISIRNARKEAIDAIKKLEKDGLSEDMAKTAEAKVQDIVNRYSSKVDDVITAKEKDIMTV
ncbi:MAG: ribosome recycling factor [Patiriisocius sp.]|jgi:ribosome recycling factor